MAQAPELARPAKRPRLFFVDYLRGWAVVVMVLAHFWPALIRPQMLAAPWGQAADFAFQFAPALFFGVVGASVAFSLGSGGNAAKRRTLLLRGSLVLLAGLPWNVMLQDPFEFDFLPFIGLSMVVCGWVAATRSLSAACAALMLACWLVLALQWHQVPAGYAWPEAHGPACLLLSAVMPSGGFPIQGWLPVSLLGLAFGGRLVRGGISGVLRWLEPATIGAVLVAAALVARSTGSPFVKFPVTLSYAVLSCGVFSLAWAACALLEGVVARAPLAGAFANLGRFALPATAIHWLVGRSLASRLGLAHHLGLPQFVAFTLATLVGLVLLYRPWMRLVERWQQCNAAILATTPAIVALALLLYAVGFAALVVAFPLHAIVSATVSCASILVLCVPLYWRPAPPR